MTELKPCPFCGKKTAMIINTGNHFPITMYRVICSVDCVMQGKLYNSETDAISEWNRRSGEAECQNT